MGIYNYVALKNNKDIVTGKVEAESLREARDNVRKLGFLPTKVTEEALKSETVDNLNDANKMHKKVGKEVRKTMIRISGKKPENLPTPSKSIKQLEKDKIKKLDIK